MRIALFLCLASVAGPVAAQSGRVVQERWRDDRPQPRGEALLRDTMLALHNKARRDVKLAPLLWDEALAQAAGRYAADLARKRRFEHSAADTRKGQGENLWMGTREAYSLAEMAQGWIDEKRWFRNRPIPDVSTTGNWADVGHYTQIVWAGTTRVGCAIAGNADDEYLVCRYGPAGNVYGQLTLPPPVKAVKKP